MFSMEGGELFTRIQDRTAFNERGQRRELKIFTRKQNRVSMNRNWVI